MKARKLRSYKKPAKSGVIDPKTGAIKIVTTFVYAVTGTPAELEKFKAAQGDNHRVDDDGTPLWFTTRFAGHNVQLIISDKGVFADMSEYDAAASLAEQFGGSLGNELAKAAANRLMGNYQDDVPAPVTKPTE